MSFWQIEEARAEGDQLAAVDQELIAVLRFQASLRSFYTRLDELAHVEDKKRLLAESDGLNKTLMDDADRVEGAVPGAACGFDYRLTGSSDGGDGAERDAGKPGGVARPGELGGLACSAAPVGETSLADVGFE